MGFLMIQNANIIFYECIHDSPQPGRAGPPRGPPRAASPVSGKRRNTRRVAAGHHGLPVSSRTPPLPRRGPLLQGHRADTPILRLRPPRPALGLGTGAPGRRTSRRRRRRRRPATQQHAREPARRRRRPRQGAAAAASARRRRARGLGGADEPLAPGPWAPSGRGLGARAVGGNRKWGPREPGGRSRSGS